MILRKNDLNILLKKLFLDRRDRWPLDRRCSQSSTPASVALGTLLNGHRQGPRPADTTTRDLCNRICVQRVRWTTRDTVELGPGIAVGLERLDHRQR